MKDDDINAGPIRSCTFRAMNTKIEVLYRTDERNTKDVDEAAADWFRSTEERFSRFLPDSELSHLNRLAGERCLVSDAMLEVLQLADAYRQKTNGVFDPLLLKRLERLGYDATFELIKERPGHQVPPAETAGALMPAVLDINPLMRSVRFPPQAKLDLGGIVKSWTVQKLAGYMQTQLGVTQGLINAGGDLIAWGGCSESHDPWLIGIENPWDPHSDIGIVALTDGAAATSSTLGRSWSTDLGKMHHLLDPRTGASADSRVVQCTVSGPEAVECEIWSKVLCILGLEEGLRLMRSRARHYEAVLFTDNQRLILYGESSSLGVKWRDISIDSIESR